MTTKIIRCLVFCTCIFSFSFNLIAQEFLSTPIAGQHLKDFITVNYVDWGLDNDWFDHKCHSKTYNGHQGTDFLIRSFAAMDSGVAVLAAASGTVIFVKNDLFDREKLSDVSKGFGNYIALNHSNGYQTYYAHIRKGSSRVKLGDFVNAGDTLALVGSSGNSSDPHLHFEVWYDSSFVVDPFKGNCGNSATLWLNPIAYDTSFRIWKSGLINFQPNLDTLREEPGSKDIFNFSEDESITYWNICYGVRKNDLLRIRWLRPNGQEWFSFDSKANQDFWYYYFWSYIDVPSLPDEGIWTVELLLNNNKIDEKKFRINPTSSTHHISNNSNIKVYPNPVIDKFTINFERRHIVQQNEIRYQLFSSFGQKIIEGTLNQCYPNCEITTESLPAGVYLLVIRDNEQRLSTHNISINQN
jgi:murein DD-endopeptidase MepM/ murein hydrolase activator NlpD